MSRTLGRWQQAILGVAVIAGLGLATTMVVAVGNRQWLWNKSFHVRVGFRQIQGVEEGTRVRVLGRDAGVVEHVHMPKDPTGEVVLRLRLDNRLHPLVRGDAVARIVSEGMIGGKILEIDPGSNNVAAVRDDAVIASQPTADLTDLIGQVRGTLEGIRNGEGSLGKLVKDDEIYLELLKLVKQGRGTMSSLKQDADAIKGMPIVRSYVQDATRLLIRPDCARYRQWIAEGELFDPGRAILTAPGRQRLDAVASWLEGIKNKGSEIVVVGYASPGGDADISRALTQKQSEVVCDYLTGQHAVQKIGWFSRRRVTPLGCGVEPPLIPQPEKPPGLEVILFIPQG